MWVFGPIDRFIHTEDGNVVVESAGVEFWMDVHRDDVAFDVGEEFDVMVDVPLTKTDS